MWNVASSIPVANDREREGGGAIDPLGGKQIQFFKCAPNKNENLYYFNGMRRAATI